MDSPGRSQGYRKMRSHIGDVTFEFHNSSGLKDRGKRAAYLRAGTKRAHVRFLCETSLDTLESIKETQNLCKTDSKIKSTMYNSACWRPKTGLAAIIRDDAPITKVIVRRLTDKNLQCMIIDMTINEKQENETHLRCMVTHTGPH